MKMTAPSQVNLLPDMRSLAPALKRWKRKPAPPQLLFTNVQLKRTFTAIRITADAPSIKSNFFDITSRFLWALFELSKKHARRVIVPWSISSFKSPRPSRSRTLPLVLQRSPMQGRVMMRALQ